MEYDKARSNWPIGTGVISEAYENCRINSGSFFGS